MDSPDREIFVKHYKHLSTKPYFNQMIDYFLKAPICSMIWEGSDVVETGRKMIGKLQPEENTPGNIRFDFSNDRGRNVIHGSDSVDNAVKEIELWFNS
jgi:nucleoside-diphosphate kinase